MTTMLEVASKAGVSTATVSRVLHTPELVSERVRDRVRSAMAELDYVPNLAGKSLRTSRTDRILVMVPDISNTFFGAVLRGIEEVAQEAGYAVLLGDTRGDAEREHQYADMYRRREADGLILLGHRLPDLLVPLAQSERRAPIVFGCEYDERFALPTVRIDNRAAAAEAMAHLVRQGHRRIGVVTGPAESPLTRERLTGARESAGDATLLVRTGDYSIASGEENAVAFFNEPDPPTAIFTFGDEMALGVISAARRFGRDCPGSIAVMGFDDIRFAQSAIPPLSTIRQPMTEIGREAARLLLNVLNGLGDTPVEVVLPYEICVREST